MRVHKPVTLLVTLQNISYSLPLADIVHVEGTRSLVRKDLYELGQRRRRSRQYFGGVRFGGWGIIMGRMH